VRDKEQSCCRAEAGECNCATLWLYMGVSEKKTGALRKKTYKSSRKWKIREKEIPVMIIIPLPAKTLACFLLSPLSLGRLLLSPLSLGTLKPAALGCKRTQEG